MRLDEIELAAFPQLQALAWNRPNARTISGADALALYERNWNLVDTNALEPIERELISRLVELHGDDCFQSM